MVWEEHLRCFHFTKKSVWVKEPSGEMKSLFPTILSTCSCLPSEQVSPRRQSAALSRLCAHSRRQSSRSILAFSSQRGHIEADSDGGGEGSKGCRPLPLPHEVDKLQAKKEKTWPEESSRFVGLDERPLVAQHSSLCGGDRSSSREISHWN